MSRRTHDINAAELVHEQHKPGQDHPSASLDTVILEKTRDLLSSSLSLNCNGLANVFDLFDNERIVFVAIKDSAEDLNSFCFASTIC
jgi:hypothetical protein